MNKHYIQLLTNAAAAEARLEVAEEWLEAGGVEEPYWYYAEKYGMNVRTLRELAVKLGVKRKFAGKDNAEHDISLTVVR